MKINKRLTGGIAMCFAMSSMFVACSTFEDREFAVDKPQSLIDQEERDAYNPLKTYINYSNQPNFKLGAELTLNEVADNSPFYRTVQEHFDELSFTGLNYFDLYKGGNAATALSVISAALETNMAVGMPVHAGHLVQHSNQDATYLNSLTADIILPGQSGTTLVEDFESKTVGNSFPVFYFDPNTTTGTAVISNDPVAGATNSGKTLKVFGNRAFPQFQVNLPTGVTLGDCKKLVFDLNIANGRYGSGIRVGISTAFGSVALNQGSPNRNYDALSAPDRAWGRKLSLDLSAFTFTADQKQLNSFVLTFNNETGTADLYMDNIALEWTKVGQVIIKTPAERKTIYTAELDKWIKAIGTAGKDKIKSWSVVYQPLDDTDPTKLRTGVGSGTLPANTFYWQDYLGRDYAATAIKMLKQYANNTDKIYITETNLVDNVAKIQGLKDYIAYTEAQGANVNGIATELALNVTTVDKTKVEAMLQALATTGKLIKISALDIGTGGNTASATPELYKQQAETYKWFVKAYNTYIPAAQRGGITFRSPYDRISSDSWRSSEPVGLWTRSTTSSTVDAGYMRKPAYVGVLEAFQEK